MLWCFLLASGSQALLYVDLNFSCVPECSSQYLVLYGRGGTVVSHFVHPVYHVHVCELQLDPHICK